MRAEFVCLRGPQCAAGFLFVRAKPKKESVPYMTRAQEEPMLQQICKPSRYSYVPNRIQDVNTRRSMARYWGQTTGKERHVILGNCKTIKQSSRGAFLKQRRRTRAKPRNTFIFNHTSSPSRSLHPHTRTTLRRSQRAAATSRTFASMRTSRRTPPDTWNIMISFSFIQPSSKRGRTINEHESVPVVSDSEC